LKDINKSKHFLNISSGHEDDDDDDEKPKDIDMDVEKPVDEDDEDNVIIPGAGPIAMHASNRDDPLLEIQDDVGSLSFF
jgi:hypothetical protein